ncbi:hypothetical protein P0082_01195 [Candidatus Haliotispira prima]|uniref:Lipoprotein n=1 Tax=Candidatus Haliotispira prima TaxID=3034016 RepID=A0ABY8MIT9_9SPIO|nr:hypothetical protein P0082_01195 [Candidatus Haliotispira prima]
MLGCAPLPDTSDPPAAEPPVVAKPSMSFSATAVVSSVQLEMSSSFAITAIGAVIRLAAEAAPTKAEAQANAGYVSLAIAADSPRKFSISQHYTTNFTDGLTLVDLLASNTDYKLYLFFEPNAISSETTIEGATLANDTAILPFTTATLPAAGDAVWNSAQTNNQFVGSLPEWGYSENQKGIFVVYTKFNIPFSTVTLTGRKEDDTEIKTLGSISIGLAAAGSGFLFEISKLGGSYPDGDNYYYVISADNTKKIVGETFKFEVFDGSVTSIRRVPLTRYSSP